MNKAAQDDLDTRLGRIAALGDPIRRALYRFVVAQPEPVGRAQAADAVGIAHHSAKFHLDKLESEGLLDIEYTRQPGRSGPGAGRPAKRYRRSAREVAVSLPERRYDIASYVMAEAITTARESDMPVAEAVQQSASALGRTLGERVRGRLGSRPSKATRVRAVTAELVECGYEPRADGDRIVLANCPFHTLAAQFPDLVCQLNFGLLEGLMQACRPAGLRAKLSPEPGRCCVTLNRDR
jgi:predicted ArsR family transcriptional regulator